MKYGIYYAYWEQQWGGDYLPYVSRVKGLGFDILEISCAGLIDMSESKISDLARAAKDAGLILTGGYGPRAQENIASPDPKIAAGALEFWKRTFEVLARLDIHVVGGGLYSYWPVDFSKPFNKGEDLKRSIEGMQKMAALAADLDITLGMEVLNRFEGYLLNTTEEALAYVKAVGKDNVKIHLDSFHMNIEEDDFLGAIKAAGSYLGHFHIGEANRRPPVVGSRMDWPGIGRALRDIGYTGAVVMEPFVLSGGQVGQDIKVWRDLAPTDQGSLDAAARESVKFIRDSFGS